MVDGDEEVAKSAGVKAEVLRVRKPRSMSRPPERNERLGFSGRHEFRRQGRDTNRFGTRGDLGRGKRARRESVSRVGEVGKQREERSSPV